MENRPSREFDFELPVGYTDEDGQVHRIASLRKMTGHEEALLADRKLRQNAARLVTQLLAACVKRIGEIAPVPRNVISELTSPDRNFLLLQLRRRMCARRAEKAPASRTTSMRSRSGG